MNKKTKFVLATTALLFIAFSCQKEKVLKEDYTIPKRLQVTSAELIDIVNNKNNRQYTPTSKSNSNTPHLYL